MKDPKYPITQHVDILKALVTKAGGPAKFADQYSKDDADKPIDATYVSQILNGHRPFRDVARRNMAKRAGLPENAFEIQYVAQESGSNQAEEPHTQSDYGTDRISRIIRKLLTLSDNHPAIQSIEWALNSIPDSPAATAGRTIDVSKAMDSLRTAIQKQTADAKNQQK